MVKILGISLSTLLPLAVLGIGLATFFGLGGASGIGQRIGSGFSSFGSAFKFGLGGAFGATQGGEQNDTTAATELTGEAPPLGLPQLLDNLQQTQGTLQGVNNFFSNLFSGALFNPSAFRTSLAFTPSAIQNRLQFSSVNKQTPRTTFGGFSNAVAQENALQQAIIEQMRSNPSFFLRG